MELQTAKGIKQLQVRRLYRRAFPRVERKPFSLLLKKQKQGAAQVLSITDDNGAFLGLLTTLTDADIVLVDYFAVAEAARQSGVGSKALEIARQKYPDKRIVLEIELPEADADEADDRVRRKHFYLRNGFTQTGVRVQLCGVPMELLNANGTVSYEEYYALLRSVWGDDTLERIIRITRMEDAPDC